MTRAEAIASLEAGNPLSTAMLEPLHLTMEWFLAFSQLTKAGSDVATAKLLRIAKHQERIAELWPDRERIEPAIELGRISDSLRFGFGFKYKQVQRVFSQAHPDCDPVEFENAMQYADTLGA